MKLDSDINLELIFKEAFLNKYFTVSVFALMSIVVLIVGVYWPKQYSSSTTIFVEEENILGPLMAGAAVQTEVTDRAAIAREIIFGHSIMYKLLENIDPIDNNPDPKIQERLVNDIKARLTISNVRNNLIKIEYKDRDPEKVYKITNHLARLFIEESLAKKARQSTDAFEFIDKQAREYKGKLQDAETDLKLFRSENVDSQPGQAEAIGRRITELRSRQEQLTQELREAKIRQASLKKQLSGEAQASNAFLRSGQYKTRIDELQSELDSLRLSYHETYPDIVQLKAQINDLRKAIKDSANNANDGPNKAEIIDEVVHSNPVYQQLQRDLYDTNTNIETLNARLEHTETTINNQLTRARKISEFEARLQELTRDYQVNSDRYSDLMRRREQARVSMNLDIDKKGLSLRIDEPAYRPHTPSGLRLLHFLIATPVIGLAIPLICIFLYLQFIPKIRSSAEVTNELKLPVLGETPHLANSSEIRKESIGVISVLAVFIFIAILIVMVGVLRIQGVI